MQIEIRYILALNGSCHLLEVALHFCVVQSIIKPFQYSKTRRAFDLNQHLNLNYLHNLTSHFTKTQSNAKKKYSNSFFRRSCACALIHAHCNNWIIKKRFRGRYDKCIYLFTKNIVMPFVLDRFCFALLFFNALFLFYSIQRRFLVQKVKGYFCKKKACQTQRIVMLNEFCHPLFYYNVFSFPKVIFFLIVFFEYARVAQGRTRVYI